MASCRRASSRRSIRRHFDSHLSSADLSGYGCRRHRAGALWLGAACKGSDIRIKEKTPPVFGAIPIDADSGRTIFGSGILVGDVAKALCSSWLDGPSRPIFGADRPARRLREDALLVADTLRPGDVLLVEGNTRMSAGGQVSDASMWSHALCMSARAGLPSFQRSDSTDRGRCAASVRACRCRSTATSECGSAAGHLTRRTASSSFSSDPASGPSVRFEERFDLARYLLRFRCRRACVGA